MTGGPADQHNGKADCEVPPAKRTKFGLYVTAKEAYEQWRAEPEAVVILDVRTSAELIFVGSAPMVWSVPVEQTYRWVPEKRDLAMRVLVDFTKCVERIASRDATILVMCRSGGRSAVAVDLLSDAGFTRVYQILDGFEGDRVGEVGSVFAGQRLKNGRKNSGCPWSYELEPERLLWSDPPGPAIGVTP
jgi:rhodanese-related sulfurtransferase